MKALAFKVTIRPAGFAPKKVSQLPRCQLIHGFSFFLLTLIWFTIIRTHTRHTAARCFSLNAEEIYSALYHQDELIMQPVICSVSSCRTGTAVTSQLLILLPSQANHSWSNYILI